MEGDLIQIQGPNAGIIPRTLYSLFDILNRETSEFSVRVSFIELYNEELKDLLSAEDDFGKLRVYEDLNRKGSVIIQGLEEIVVKNVADVIAILQKGSNKKQIAATKMNDASRYYLILFTYRIVVLIVFSLLLYISKKPLQKVKNCSRSEN
jgi:kinesin family protein 11